LNNQKISPAGKSGRRERSGRPLETLKPTRWGGCRDRPPCMCKPGEEANLDDKQKGGGGGGNVRFKESSSLGKEKKHIPFEKGTGKGKCERG